MANIDGSMHLTSNLTAEFGAGSIVANPYHITITDIEGGHRLTVTRGNETQTMNVMDGDPGYSPTITISEIEGGHTVVIVDHAGTHQFNVMDGVRGVTGNGIANTVLNDDYTLTITYTDGSSYTSPSIRGEKGDEGIDGFSPTVSVAEITDGHRVTITDAQGAHVFDVMDGQDGADVPTKLSELENDVGYITEDDIPAETDPTVPSWAKQQDKPTYNANEVGAVSANQGVQHSGKIMGVNTEGVVVPVDSPVAGVSSVNGMTGNVTIEAEDIGAYEKPTAGIPASDMASSVQASLSNADNAATQSALDTEVGARQQADNALQEQIDALVSKSDVVDVVGTYAELQAYDTSALGDKDVVKVLSDSTHDNARTYYRWIISGSSGSWTYVGGESVGYTKAETDTLLNAKQDAISDLSTIRSGASAGATAYQKPSSGVPKTDLASDVKTSLGLADSALQSESDPVFSASPAHGITSQNIQSWNAKQDAISDLETIRSGAAAGATAVQPSTLDSYATQTYVDQQIAAAISGAIGGEY